MAHATEIAMNKLKQEAEAVAKKQFPGLRDLIICISDNAAIIEVKTAKGHWQRYRYTGEAAADLAQEEAESVGQMKRITYGKKLP